MRTSFFNALFEVAKKDPQVVLITADMGFGLLERFRDELPNQYINSGISEANSISVAAGMALLGKKAYVYSIAPFVTYRPFEQVRLDVCYHNANVKIIGVGSGLDYGQSGPTHQATEDICVMRALPNMQVACPADPVEAAALPEAINQIKTPVFVRLGRGKEPVVHKKAPEMKAGKALSVFRNDSKTKKIVIFSTGNLVYNSVIAAQRIAADGYSMEVFSMPWIKPIDGELILREADEAGLIITVEEHSEIGGLWSSVCEVLMKNGTCRPIKSIALPDAFQKEVGSQAHLRVVNGLDPDGIEKRIRGWIAGASL